MERDYFPTLSQLIFIRRNPSEDIALEFLFKNRWGDKDPECLNCGNEGKWYRLADRKSYAHGCSRGGHVSPLAGTIFENSHIPLVSWYGAIEDIYKSDGKVPAHELQRRYGGSYVTTWRMKKLICDYLRLDKGYSYKWSSKENGRHSQIRKGIAMGRPRIHPIKEKIPKQPKVFTSIIDGKEHEA
jgi:hypothetical protein